VIVNILTQPRQGGRIFRPPFFILIFQANQLIKSLSASLSTCWVSLEMTGAL
jgi:hypothetical protein